MAPLFLVTYIRLRLCSHGFTCMDCSVATPLSKKWSKYRKHDLIDGRRGTYFDNCGSRL